MNILTLLSEDMRLQALLYHTISSLDLLARTWVGHHGLVDINVIVVTQV
jgi:hypothetical protein